jgi:phenylalanine-4-hydroxylase
LSSYGEIQVFRQAEVTPIDIGAMGRQIYDITHFQPTLFSAGSFEDMFTVLSNFFDRYDENEYARLGGS